MNFQNSKSIKMTQSAHQGKQIHLGWARIHQRWQKNVPQNQHWTVAFLNLKNIKMLLRKVCARWNRSHRFPGVSHLQELHCKTLGWVSVVQQCKFNRPLVLHTTSIYTIDWFPGKHLLSQLSASAWTTIATFIFSKSLSLYTL